MNVYLDSSFVIRQLLGVRPERVIADVDVSPDGVLVDRVRLDWPDKDEEMHINGFCRIDLARQEIVGDVEGRAKQAHIRPMIEVLEVPVALP